MNIVELTVAYSGLILTAGAAVLAVPIFLAVHYNWKHNESWPLRTTVPTFFVLCIFTWLFLAMEWVLPGLYFWVTAFAEGAAAAAWGILVWQGAGE